MVGIHVCLRLKSMGKQRSSGGPREYEKFRLEEVGKKIRDLRNDLGYSQKRLAQLASETRYGISVTQPQIGNIESGNGENLPSLRLMGALAVVLETSTDFLYGLTDDEMARTDREHQVVKDVEDDGVRAALQEICNFAIESEMSVDDLDLLLILAQRISGKQSLSSEITPVTMATMFKKIREVSGEEGEAKLFDLLESLAPGTFRSRRRRGDSEGSQ